jgi:hypothetical protein
MSVSKQQVHYRPRLKNFREQWKTIRVIAAFFIMTVVYALYLHNAFFRTVLLLLSLVYPVVIAMSILGQMPRFNYAELTNEGIRLTQLGFLHRMIRWSDISTVGEVSAGGVAGLGITYKHTHKTWTQQFRQRHFGWDDMITDRYAPNGTSLARAVERQFKPQGSRPPQSRQSRAQKRGKGSRK